MAYVIPTPHYRDPPTDQFDGGRVCSCADSGGHVWRLLPSKALFITSGEGAQHRPRGDHAA